MPDAKSTTAGAILLKRIFPRDMWPMLEEGPIDKKRIYDLMSEVAKTHPDQYREILQDLHELGEEVAKYYGGESSLTSESFLLPQPLRLKRLAIQRDVDALQNNTSLPKQEKRLRILGRLKKGREELKSLIMDSMEGTSFPLQVKSGARGSIDALADILVGPIFTTSSEGDEAAIPILHGYAEGLTPAEYWLSSYAARLGYLGTKMATPVAGHIANQLVGATQKLRVTEKDCGTHNGISIDPKDPDYEGAVLARDYGEIAKRNDVLDPRLMRELSEHYDQVVVRSPITCEAELGVCQKAAGKIPEYPEIGDFIGISAAQSLSEPLSQSQLCLAAGTEILLADGSHRKIEDIQKGTMILGCSLEGVVKPVRVLAVHVNGKKECLRTTFCMTSGRRDKTTKLEMIATPDHKILSDVHIRSNNPYHFELGIRPVGTKMLNKNDHFCAHLPHDFDDAGLEDEPYALLVGLLVGDGCYTASGEGSISLACKDEKLVQDMEERMAHLQVRLSRHKNDYNIGFGVIKLANNASSENPLGAWLRKEGMYGQYSHEKTLPRSIYNWPNKSIAALFSGLLAADGSISERGLSLSSSSEKLIRGIRQLIGIRFGIWHTSIYTHIPRYTHNGESKEGRRAWRLTVAKTKALQRLSRVLDIPGKKQAQFMRLVEKKTNGDPPHALQSFPRLYQEPVGLFETYDLTVDHPDHLFLLANGLVVSNSLKHQGQRTTSGLDLIEQLINVPKGFTGEAPVAEEGGVVSTISSTPTGGKSIKIGAREYPIEPGLEPKVKSGQRVEPGDVLSTGIPNPATIARVLGIGDARRRFVDIFSDALKESGIGHNKRNIEFIARGLVDHARIDKPYGDFLPGDIVEFSALSRHYQPREGAVAANPTQSVGRYLEKPVAYHTIGTRITRPMAKELKALGYGDLLVHSEPPPFSPEMRRAMDASRYSLSWMDRLGGFYLKRSLLDALYSGQTSSDPTNPVDLIPQIVMEGRIRPIKEE